ncbi:MAG: hypothetical protein ACRBF0_24960 [Calditrichia bacterium]
MSKRNLVFIALILIALVDMIIPVPLLALLLMWVLADRSPWFKKLVEDVYR